MNVYYLTKCLHTHNESWRLESVNALLVYYLYCTSVNQMLGLRLYFQQLSSEHSASAYYF